MALDVGVLDLTCLAVDQRGDGLTRGAAGISTPPVTE
jgi:hypothetical protein